MTSHLHSSGTRLPFAGIKTSEWARLQTQLIARFALVFGLLTAVGCGTDQQVGSDADAGAVAADGSADGVVNGGADAGVDGAISGVPKLFINEIAAKAAPVQGFNETASDWLELYNDGDTALQLQGYRLIDSAKKTFDEALPLPPNTEIAAKGFLVVFFNAEGNGTPVIQKGLGKDEAATLFHPSGLLLDRVNWEEGDAPEGATWGRYPDGADVLKTLAKPTPNASNE